MAMHKVRLVNSELNIDKIISVPEEEYILDIAETLGIRLPSGCKQGECSACVAKLISGTVDQSEQKFLKQPEIDAGYIVTCVAYPLADCVIETHQEKTLYKSALYFSPPS